MKRSIFLEWEKHSRATAKVVSPASKPAIIIINKHINLLFWESSVCTHYTVHIFLLCKRRIENAKGFIGFFSCILHTFEKSRAALFPHHGDFLERTLSEAFMLFKRKLKLSRMVSRYFDMKILKISSAIYFIKVIKVACSLLESPFSSVYIKDCIHFVSRDMEKSALRLC